VLGAEPVAVQAHRLTAGQAQHQREGLGGWQVEPHQLFPLPVADGLRDPAADGLGCDPQLAEGGHGPAPAVAEQAEQQVFGADPVVAEPAGPPAWPG
jgi:hypothetical protein